METTVPASATTAPVMSVKDWVITYIITIIPIVGIVMLFVWAFSSGQNPNKSNWAKAALIVAAIMMVLYFLVFAAILGPMMSSLSGGGSY